jgi:zinc protease
VTKLLPMAATCIAGALLALTPVGPATPARAAVFDAETFTLDNGLQVVVVTNRRAPVVTHWVWYKVGTADSPLGKSGLPHFLEHLMFKRTETRRPASSRGSSAATAATTTP